MQYPLQLKKSLLGAACQNSVADVYPCDNQAVDYYDVAFTEKVRKSQQFHRVFTVHRFW